MLDPPYDADALRARVLYSVEYVDLPFGGSGPRYAEALDDPVEDRSGLPDTVATVAGRLRDADVETTVHSTRGAPTNDILEIVDAMDADAVVFGCRRHTPVGKVVFGSAAQEVIRRADCPVVVASR